MGWLLNKIYFLYKFYNKLQSLIAKVIIIVRGWSGGGLLISFVWFHFLKLDHYLSQLFFPPEINHHPVYKNPFWHGISHQGPKKKLKKYSPIRVV